MSLAPYISRLRTVAVGAALVHASVEARAQHALSPTQMAYIDSTAMAELIATRTPGSALAIVVGDRVIYSHAYGISNVETGSAMTTEMVFRLGSTTKMMTALAVLSLAGKGQLDIDTPIGTYATSLASARLRGATLRQLLTHTAGILDFTSMLGPHDDAAHNAFIPTLTDTIFFTQPGDIVSYSNLGYTVAGYVASVVAKKPYADAMADEVFKPLGMSRSTLRPTEAMTFPLAQGHGRGTNGEMTLLRPVGDDARYWPAGSAFTNVADFSRLLIAFLNAGKVDGKEAIPPALVRTALTPHAEVATARGSEPRKYGFGLTSGRSRGVDFIDHGGARAGYGSVMRMIPAQRVAVVVLGNQSGISLNRTLNAALEAVATLTPAESPAATTPSSLSAEDVSRLAGTYFNSPNSGLIELYPQDGTLRARQRGSGSTAQELGAVQVTGPGSYRAGGLNFLVVNGKDGRSTYLTSGLRAFRKRVSEGR